MAQVPPDQNAVSLPDLRQLDLSNAQPLQLEQLKNRLDELIAKNQDPEIIEQLVSTRNQLEAVISMYVALGEAIAQVNENEQNVVREDVKVVCVLCKKTLGEDDQVWNCFQCSSDFCLKCLKNYLESAVTNSRDILNISCPQQGCEQKFSYVEMEQIIEPSFMQTLQAKRLQAVVENENSRLEKEGIIDQDENSEEGYQVLFSAQDVDCCFIQIGPNFTQPIEGTAAKKELQILLERNTNCCYLQFDDVVCPLMPQQLTLSIPSSRMYVFPSPKKFPEITNMVVFAVYLPPTCDQPFMDQFDTLLSRMTTVRVQNEAPQQDQGNQQASPWQEGKAPGTPTDSLRPVHFEEKNKAAIYIEKKGYYLRNGLISVAMHAGKGLMRGSNYIGSKMTKKEGQVSRSTIRRIRYVRLAAGKLRDGARVVLNSVTTLYKKVGNTVSSTVTKSTLYKKATEGPPTKKGTATKQIAGASIEAVIGLYHGLRDSVRILSEHSKASVVNVAQHKYGNEVGFAVQEALDAVRDVGLAAYYAYSVVGTSYYEIAAQTGFEAIDQSANAAGWVTGEPLLQTEMDHKFPLFFNPRYLRRYVVLTAEALVIYFSYDHYQDSLNRLKYKVDWDKYDSNTSESKSPGEETQTLLSTHRVPQNAIVSAGQSQPPESQEDILKESKPDQEDIGTGKKIIKEIKHIPKYTWLYHFGMPLEELDFARLESGSSDVTRQHNRPNCFIVQVRDDNWHFFSADSMEEAQKWVDTITKYMVIAKERKRNKNLEELDPNNPNLPTKASFDPSWPELECPESLRPLSKEEEKELRAKKRAIKEARRQERSTKNGHFFGRAIYSTPVQCRVCQQSIWGGVMVKAYECKECKFVSHKDCIGDVIPKCQGKIGFRSSVQENLVEGGLLLLENSNNRVYQPFIYSPPAPPPLPPGNGLPKGHIKQSNLQSKIKARISTSLDMVTGTGAIRFQQRFPEIGSTDSFYEALSIARVLNRDTACPCEAYVTSRHFLIHAPAFQVVIPWKDVLCIWRIRVPGEMFEFIPLSGRILPALLFFTSTNNEVHALYHSPEAKHFFDICDYCWRQALLEPVQTDLSSSKKSSKGFLSSMKGVLKDTQQMLQLDNQQQPQSQQQSPQQIPPQQFPQQSPQQFPQQSPQQFPQQFPQQSPQQFPQIPAQQSPQPQKPPRSIPQQPNTQQVQATPHCIDSHAAQSVPAMTNSVYSFGPNDPTASQSQQPQSLPIDVKNSQWQQYEAYSSQSQYPYQYPTQPQYQYSTQGNQSQYPQYNQYSQAPSQYYQSSYPDQSPMSQQYPNQFDQTQSIQNQYPQSQQYNNQPMYSGQFNQPEHNSAQVNSLQYSYTQPMSPYLAYQQSYQTQYYGQQSGQYPGGYSQY